MDEVFGMFADKSGLVSYRKFIDWVLDETSERGDHYTNRSGEKSSVQEKSIIYDNRQNISRVVEDASPIKGSSRISKDKSEFNYNIK